MKKHQQIRHLKNMGIDVWLDLDSDEPITISTNLDRSGGIKSIELCDDCNTPHKYSNYISSKDSVDLVVFHNVYIDSNINQALTIKYEKLLGNIIYSTGIKITKVSVNDFCCLNLFNRKIDKIRPARILILGQTVANKILETNNEIDILRGNQHEFKDILLNITYDLADILNNAELKRLVWKDLCLFRKDMENK